MGEMMNTYDSLRDDSEGDRRDAGLLGLDGQEEDGGMTSDAMVASDEAEPYIAPSDPPVLAGGPEGAVIANGFAPSDEGAEALTRTDSEATRLADEEITEAVQYLLRLDAATSALHLTVTTASGTVYLRGTVPTLQDSDLATEVAGRVPDVIDVVDETVASL